MAKKITKREYFNQLLTVEEVASNQGLVDFINHELELLDKKNGSAKPTKEQVANEGIRATILEVLENSEPVTISQMQKDGRLAEYSNQKLSALVRQLVQLGKIVRTEEKKVAYFALSE